MKKDEIIELLKNQNQRLSEQVDALIAEVTSLKEALLQKDESLSKQKRIAKGFVKLASNTSEKQAVIPTQEEQ